MILPKARSQPRNRLLLRRQLVVVISSTDGRERIRTSPYVPLLSIICPKAYRSSTVETSPPAPDSKAGGLLQLLFAGSSMSVNSPVVKSVP